jgi:hypothetical protein
VGLIGCGAVQLLKKVAAVCFVTRLKSVQDLAFFHVGSPSLCGLCLVLVLGCT